MSNRIDDIEAAILNSRTPVKILENKLPVIEVNGVKGYWVNKDEVENWRGTVPLDQYEINYDKNPKIIKKKINKKIDQNQLIGVNYLRPPTPPKPGDIIIREGPPRQAPPLSPIIKRELIYVYKNSCNKKKSSKNKSARSNSARPSSAEPGKCNQRSVTPSYNYGSFQNLSYQPMYQPYQQSYGSQAYLPGFISYPSYPQFYY